jgi:hypothetical protein
MLISKRHMGEASIASSIIFGSDDVGGRQAEHLNTPGVSEHDSEIPGLRWIMMANH